MAKIAYNYFMRKSIKNCYKQPGVFSCRHPAHSQFNYEVSPYHVLKISRCWPEGCVEFSWRCLLFDKGHKCPRKFKHVGRPCFSCKQYYEIKNCYAPVSRLDEVGMRDFIDAFHEYDGWLEGMQGKTIGFSGIVESIRPHLTMKIGRQGNSIRMDDYFISFGEGHLGNDLFDDRIYLRISGGFLSRAEPAPGDEIECDAIFGIDKGRIILRNPRRIDHYRKGGESHLTPSKALVGRSTGKIITGSVSFCRDCPFCCLMDIEDDRRQKQSFYRRFYCLRGIIDPEHCPARLGLLSHDEPDKRKAKRF